VPQATDFLDLTVHRRLNRELFEFCEFGRGPANGQVIKVRREVPANGREFLKRRKQPRGKRIE
jgi:hypothetical protein